MMNRMCILLLLFLSSFLSHGQYTINGTFIGVFNEMIMLVQTEGSRHNMIDSTHLDENGSFKFRLSPELEPGDYQLFTASGISLDLIFNHENIRFIALHDSYNQQVQIVESAENMIYYDFINLKERNLVKLDILSNVINYYPKEDDFYQRTVDKVFQLRAEISKVAADLVDNNPMMLAPHFIKVQNPVFADIDMTEEAQKFYLQRHYFDHVDFNDTILLNSHLLNSKIISYLSLYQDLEVDKETFERNLLGGVDTVLQKASINQSMYTYVVDFLIGGFEAIGFEKGLTHIARHNQLDELCVNTERLEALQHKIELINRLAIGKKAPSFETIDLEGNFVSLYDIASQKTLLFFWASWCPHCKNMIHELNKIYNAPENDIQVVGISIDTSLTDLRAVISEYKIDWPVVAELEGWEGSIPNQYGLVATPTIFLLDQDKTILTKPTNESELKDFLNQ
ncbi:MAG: redoxin domain-containing protein [Bacteroidales bacterium]|nr:redoxin domain-containing protein [Bacteroidales bacterium]